MIHTLILMLSLSGVQITHHGDINMIDADHQVNVPVVINVSGTINESTANSFAASMMAAHETGQPIIPIVIRSFGGSVYSLLSMIDIIENSTVPVATIVVGKAMSAGAVLLSCGTEGMRYSSPHATIMIHEVSSSVRGKVGDIKADTKETARLNKLLLTIMSKNIGKKPDYISKIIHSKGHADWYLNAKDAKKYNIVNHIGYPKFKMDITIRTVFE